MNTNTDNINLIVSEFNTVSLKETEKVKFLKRSDTKYVFHRDSLSEFLNDLKSEYKALVINDNISQEYKTIYYDLPELAMFTAHHNGVRDRFKVRCRKYMSSGEIFLEVKKKNNKNITSKKRILIDNLKLERGNNNHSQFITKHIPYNINDLVPSIESKFIRLTLVNKDIPERITIDYNLTFKNPNKEEIGETEDVVNVNTSNLCIAEIKRDAGAKNIIFDRILKKNRIYPMGFSKYCMGLAFMYPMKKINRFKPRIHIMKKNGIIRD